MSLSPMNAYLGDIDQLIAIARAGDKEYAQPALKNLGSISIPILREIVAPASFRNADSEITDVNHGGVRRVRAVANKFKYGERSRGLQVLRYFAAGGAMPQNKTEFNKGEKASAAYDLNTIVFGDSANHGKYVLPVKAAAQYSDAVSIKPYSACVDETFHNRASEDGTLWDAQENKNSVNIFERHFLLPGVLLLQVISFNGRTAPPLALEHLLLSIGLAGAYGGATSIYGVNVRNHVVGIYGGRFEQDLASPYVALQKLLDANGEELDASGARAGLDSLFSQAYATRVSGDQAHQTQRALVEKLENNDADLVNRYVEGKEKIGAYFDSWFAIGKS